MPEPSLAVAFKDLTGDVGRFLGYGRGADNGEGAWTDDQQRDVDRCVKGGMRKFYHCGHDWSFQRITVTLTLLSGQSTLPLPDDYGSHEGQVVIADPQHTNWWPLDYGQIGAVYQRAAELPTATGRPQIMCEEPIKGTTVSKGQRSQLRFWPTADQDYPLRVMYYVNRDYLSGALPYAYGGPQHAETLLESCLAVAEKLIDDKADTHSLEFDRCLAVSKDIDRRNKPASLGYNADRSDLLHWPNDRRHAAGQTPVTFAGVEY